MKYLRKGIMLAVIFTAGVLVGCRATPKPTTLKKGDSLTITYPSGPKVMGANNTGEAQQPMKTVDVYIYRTASEVVAKPEGDSWYITQNGTTFFLVTK